MSFCLTTTKIKMSKDKNKKKFLAKISGIPFILEKDEKEKEETNIDLSYFTWR